MCVFTYPSPLVDSGAQPRVSNLQFTYSIDERRFLLETLQYRNTEEQRSGVQNVIYATLQMPALMEGSKA